MAWRRQATLSGFCLVEEIQNKNAKDFKRRKRREKEAKVQKKENRSRLKAWMKDEYSGLEKICARTLLITSDDYLEKVKLDVLEESILDMERQNVRSRPEGSSRASIVAAVSSYHHQCVPSCYCKR